MTIQEKVEKMQSKLSSLKNETENENKRWCFSLLHDALVHSKNRIETMPIQSLLSFIELTGHTVTDPDPRPKAVHNELVRLGWWVQTMN